MALAGDPGGRPQRHQWHNARLPLALLLFTPLVLAPLLLAYGGRLEKISQALRWQGKELVSSRNSPYQNIAVLRNQEQQTIYTDGRPLYTFPDADIEAAELFVHLPLLAHPAPQRVLLLGGGAGGVLAEILKYGTIRRVDYLELDPAILESVRRFADPASRQALADPRVRVHYRDGREFVRSCASRYDIILIGTPLPENLQENRYFSVEFFRQLALLLADKGIVATLAPGSTTYYGPEMKRMTESLLATCKAAFTHALVIPGDQNLFLAANGLNLEGLFADELAGRLAARRVQPRLITREHLRWLFDPSQLAWFHANISGGGVVNSDLEPYLLARQIFQTTATFNPSLKPLLDRLGRLSAVSLLPWAVLLAAVVTAVCRYRPEVALPYLITTTGCVAMILELALMLLFQLVHGAMIQTIGLLIALFMAGLWCGSMLTSARRPAQQDFRWLAGGEAGFVLLCGTLALLFSVSGFTTSLSATAAYALILPLLLLCGFLTGLQFPPAVRTLRRGERQWRKHQWRQHRWRKQPRGSTHLRLRPSRGLSRRLQRRPAAASRARLSRDAAAASAAQMRQFHGPAHFGNRWYNKKMISRRAFMQTVCLSALALQAGAREIGSGVAGRREALWYQKLDDGKGTVTCALCPRRCTIPDGGSGFCRARKNFAGTLTSLGYALPCSINVDPVEKKPFFNFHPSTRSLSLACAGCNLRCKFCQNWEISQLSPLESRNYLTPVAQVPTMAIAQGCKSVAFTYTEPVTYFEYMLDVARAARAKGVLAITHSNGYINPEPQAELCRHLDAANIDLKGFQREILRLRLRSGACPGAHRTEELPATRGLAGGHQPCHPRL